MADSDLIYTLICEEPLIDERVVAALGLADRVVFLATDWASSLDDGETLDISDRDLSPKRANAMYSRYYDRVRSLGWPVLTLPEGATVSTRDHQWGPGPFHYTQSAYAHLAEGIRSAADASG